MVSACLFHLHHSLGAITCIKRLLQYSSGRNTEPHLCKPRTEIRRYSLNLPVGCGTRNTMIVIASESGYFVSCHIYSLHASGLADLSVSWCSQTTNGITCPPGGKFDQPTPRIPRGTLPQCTRYDIRDLCPFLLDINTLLITWASLSLIASFPTVTFASHPSF